MNVELKDDNDDDNDDEDDDCHRVIDNDIEKEEV